MMRLLGLTTALILTFAAAAANASDFYIKVGKAQIKKSILAIDNFNRKPGTSNTDANKIRDLIKANMEFTGFFNLLNKNAFLDKSAGLAIGNFSWGSWSTIGADLLIKGEVSASKGNLVFEAYLYNVRSKKELMHKKYQSARKDLRTLAHKVSDDLYQELTGKPGIFSTHLAFICDGSGKKELYISDYDGANPIQLTKLRSLVVGPSWTPDGSTLYFSVFRKHKGNIKNLDLESYNIRTGTLKLISSKKGINSGAAVSPDGKKVALTMSFLGNSEIFIIDLESKLARRVTNHWANDVDPSWSNDGKRIIFISDRAGRPMVFEKAIDGSSSPRRITYAGRYNATPNYSPTGNYIVFTSMETSEFNLFLVTPDGKKLERLTKNQGSNEDPHFSPNGQFVVYSKKQGSKRVKDHRIYIMDIRGATEKQVTFANLGNCTQPRWSQK